MRGSQLVQFVKGIPILRIVISTDYRGWDQGIADMEPITLHRRNPVSRFRLVEHWETYMLRSVPGRVAS